MARYGVIMIALALAGTSAFCLPKRLTMQEHMRIQAEIRSDPALERLPSLQIDAMQAEVPLDDRMNADAAFSRPFVASLKDGMAWYLKERGVRVSDGAATDLRLVGTIVSYEGWRGWGRWGADVTLKVKLFRGDHLMVTEPLRSFLKYSDEEDVEDEEKPRYRAQGLGVSFTEILFTRIGVDLSEKLIVLLKERTPGVPAAGATGPAGATPGAAPDAVEAVKRELEARYVENEAGFYARDPDRVMRLRHPEFHTITPDGKVSSREQMYQRTRDFIGRIERFDHLSETILSLTLEGDTAHAVVDQRTVRQQRLGDGTLHEVRTSVVQRESWKRTPEGWLLWRVDEIQPGKTLVDGKPLE
jgi:hypothetical protein